MLLGIVVVPLIGIGTVYAVSTLTKNDEIKLKQEMKSKDVERSVDLIGVFAPGFVTELTDAKTEYTKEYGDGNFQILEYNGYTFLIPPGKLEKLADVKEKIDTLVADNNKKIPSDGTEAKQIAKIRQVFGTQGEIAYDITIGAYTDEKGFQYNFSDGELINKQVGINSSLQTKFEQAYPKLKQGVVNARVITNEQAKSEADQIIDKVFTEDIADSLKKSANYVDLGNARVGIVYGNMEAQVLVDQATGDIINFNKAK
jgi:hypothetical protein